MVLVSYPGCWPGHCDCLAGNLWNGILGQFDMKTLIEWRREVHFQNQMYLPLEVLSDWEEDIMKLQNELTRLRERDELLACLERHGVDNWSGWDEARKEWLYGKSV